MRAPERYRPKYLLSLAAVSLLLSGCGVYLHDEGLRRVADSAQEKAGTLNLQSVIKTARDNRKELTEQQVTLLQRSATSRANIRLAQAVTSDQSVALSVWRSKNFTDDLAALGVKSNATLENLDKRYLGRSGDGRYLANVGLAALVVREQHIGSVWVLELRPPSVCYFA